MSNEHPILLPRRLVALLLLLLLMQLTLGGCGARDEAGGDPVTLAESGAYTLGGGEPPGTGAPLRFAAEPRLKTITLDDESRLAIVLDAVAPAGSGTGSWSWRVRVPPEGRLQVGLGVLGEDPPPVEGLVTLRSNEEREILAVLRPASEEGGSGWTGEGIDLSRWAGREVLLEMAAHAPIVRTGGSAPEVAWSSLGLTGSRRAPKARRPPRPNILLIVVDTLRYDHLTAYRYERETSPEIDRLLVRRGTVVEDAYSQAPWTLPSVASYMTSRYPGEFLGHDAAAYGIPEGLPSLPEVLADLGYRTGGFVGNPTLRPSNGFRRGFETFYTAPSLQSIQEHADEINRRALSWLHARRDRPFFLYVHYIDPHDPYMNPDVVDGRSPYFDDPGGFPGSWVHGVYTGRIAVENLDRQRRHFTALYDTEIRYVDRAIGELLRAIPPEILAETLVVLTSDHGEELYDHGGWKHGHTLYEEQIHVPLLVRWDGRVPSGERLAGTVRLVDLAPTLVAAAAGEAPGSWQGIDLLGALTGEERLPRLAAFSQHLSSGPVRVASVLDGKKLIRFNRQEPYEPSDELQAHLYRLDMERLERTELYHLDSDPEERHELSKPTDRSSGGVPAGTGAPPAEIEHLDALLRHHLHTVLGGLRAWAEAVPPGSRLTGTLRFEREPEAPVSLFLGPDDRLSRDGTRVDFRIVGEAVLKGFLVPGDPGALVGAELFLDGEPLAPGRLRYGGGRPFTGSVVEPSELAWDEHPASADLPGVLLTRFGGTRPERERIDPEIRKSLKALGYVQ